MKLEFELQVQAYLDGELPPPEARRVAERLAAEPNARALAAELATTKTWLADNELPVPLPDSREFYWSRIERELDRLEAPINRPAQASPWQFWLKYIAPVAGVALAVLLGVIITRQDPAPQPEPPPEDSYRYLAETENLSEHTTSFAFRSQRENMFVVWISNKEPKPAPETQPAPSAPGVIYQ